MENKLEILTERWEFQRSIKNLMGKYSNMIILIEKEKFSKIFGQTEVIIVLHSMMDIIRVKL